MEQEEHGAESGRSGGRKEWCSRECYKDGCEIVGLVNIFKSY